MQVSVTFDSKDGDIGKNLALLASVFGAETIKVEVPVLLNKASVAAMAAPKAAATVHDKPKRHRRTKAELEAARAHAVNAKARGELHEQDEGKDVDAEFESEEVKGETSETTADNYDFGVPETAARSLTLEGDVMPAFLKYSQKHGRPAAGKILSKFVEPGAALNVRLIPEEKYPEVLGALS